VGKKKPCQPKPKEYPLGIGDTIMSLHKQALLMKLEREIEFLDCGKSLKAPKANPAQVLTSVIIK
jgi:hypothetical protein